jgi:hypothetical protein
MSIFESNDYKLSELQKINEIITEQNNKVENFIKNGFENNLAEIKDFYVKKYKEIDLPYTEEEINKWSWVKLIPRNLYLYLTNISRTLYTLEINKYGLYTIEETSYDEGIADMKEYMKEYMEDIETNIDANNDAEILRVKQTHFQISAYSDEYDNNREHYLSLETGEITELHYSDMPRKLFDSFDEYIYNDIGIAYQKIYKTGDKIYTELEWFALTYNALRAMSGLPSLRYES